MKDEKAAADAAQQKAAADAAKQSSLGRGGNAITAGDGAMVDLSNVGGGIVRAGKGGTGGSGGDAIHVAPGVSIKIINEGLIAGGDAGDAKAHPSKPSA